MNLDEILAYNKHRSAELIKGSNRAGTLHEARIVIRTRGGSYIIAQGFGRTSDEAVAETVTDYNRRQG